MKCKKCGKVMIPFITGHWLSGGGGIQTIYACLNCKTIIYFKIGNRGNFSNKSDKIVVEKIEIENRVGT